MGAGSIRAANKRATESATHCVDKIDTDIPLSQANAAHSAALPTDHLGRPLGDRVDRRGGVGRQDRRHDGCVGDAHAADAVHPQFAVDDRRLIRENAIAAIVTDGSQPSPPSDLPGRAVALREALLGDGADDALTPAEKTMMAEWLDRLADQHG